MEKPKARSRKIIFRLSDEQYQEIMAAAKKCTLTVSEYARQKLHEGLGSQVVTGSRIASAEGE